MTLKSMYKKLYANAQVIVVKLRTEYLYLTTRIKEQLKIKRTNIEINIDSIRRVLSNDFKVLLATSELQLLHPYINKKAFHTGKMQDKTHVKPHGQWVSIDVLDNALKMAKSELENPSEFSAILTNHVYTIEKYLDPNETFYLLTELRISEIKSWLLEDHIGEDEAKHYEQQILLITKNYIEMTARNEKKSSINTAALKLLLADLKVDLLNVIALHEHHLDALRQHIHTIDKQVSTVKRESKDLHSFIDVYVNISNKSNNNLVLPPIALIRIDVSKNSYVDLALNILGAQDHIQVPKKSTKRLHYRSKILHSLSIKDQAKLMIFSEIAGNARLLNLDINQKIYASNTVAFANHSEQGTVFDRLKEAASS